MSAVSTLLGWSNLVDSAGRKVKSYHLSFNEGGMFDWWTKLIAGGVNLIWIGFMLISTVSATIIGLVVTPSWLNWISDLYERITSGMFQYFNPVWIAVITFTILLLFILFDKVKSTSMGFDKQDVNRFSAGIVLFAAVVFLAANPFLILKTVLEFNSSMISSFTDTSVSNSAFSVDTMIRQPTLIINYGGAVSGECAEAWSKAGDLKGTAGSCFDKGGDTPSEQTVFVAGLAIFMSVCSFIFAVVAGWKFFLHMSKAVFGFVSIPWVAAASLAKRRQFDSLSTIAAIGLGNFIIAYLIQLFTILGPMIVMHMMQDWGQSNMAIPQMLLLSISWLVLTGLIVVIARKNGPLVRALKANYGSTLSQTLGAGAGPSMFGESNTNIVGGAKNELRAIGNTFERHAHRFAKGKAAETMRTDPSVAELTSAQMTVKMVEPGSNVFRKMLPIGKSANKPKPYVPSYGDGAPSKNAPYVPSYGDGAPNKPKPYVPSYGDGAPNKSKPYVPSYGEGKPSTVELDGGRSVSVAEGKPSADEVRREVIMGNMTSDDPSFGGRSPRTVIEDTVSENIDKVNTAAQAAPKGDGGRLPDPPPAPNTVNKPTATQMLDSHERIRSMSSRRDVRSMDVSDGEPLTMAQRVMQAGKETAKERLRARFPKVRRTLDLANALRGGTATPGDVRSTAPSHYMDRADMEILSNHEMQKARASGKAFIVSFPTDDDRVMDILFTPDRNGNPVAALNGVGYGDRTR